MGAGASAVSPPASNSDVQKAMKLGFTIKKTQTAEFVLSFDEDDIKSIKASWKNVEVEEFAKEVLLELFRVHPNTKKTFKFDGLAFTELRKRKPFIHHAHQFVVFFGDVISNLDNDDEIIKLAKKIGRRHVAIAARDRKSNLFDPVYWISVAFIASNKVVQMSKVDLEEDEGEGLRRLWRVLLLRVVAEMMISFYRDWLLVS